MPAATQEPGWLGRYGGWLAAAGLGAICLYFALHALSSIDSGRTGDFRHFYFAAQAMRTGEDVYASGERGYLYPPLWAFLIQPLASLDIQHAAKVQAIFNSLAVLAAVVLGAREGLRRLTGVARAGDVALAALITCAVLSGPLRAEIKMGQTNSWVLLALVGALTVLDRRPEIAGLLLAFAFNIKFQAIAFLPYLLLRRRWNASIWFLAGIVAWSLLPALSTGWSGNLHSLAVAYSGVLDLVGIPTPFGVATKNPMGVGFSLSVSSTMARLVGAGHEGWAWVLSLLILGVCTGVAVRFYQRAGVPLLRWPRAAEQRHAPWRAITAWEWGGIVVLALAFSPQTNSRHLVQLSLLVAIGAALVITSPRWRWMAIAGLTVLELGISLPPGTASTREAVLWWRGVGGQASAILLCYALLLRAGLMQAAEGQDRAVFSGPGSGAPSLSVSSE